MIRLIRAVEARREQLAEAGGDTDQVDLLLRRLAADLAEMLPLRRGMALRGRVPVTVPAPDVAGGRAVRVSGP